MLYKIQTIIKYTLAYYLKFFYIIIGYSITLLGLLALLNTNTFDIYAGDLYYTLMNSQPSFLAVIVLIIFAAAVQSFFSTMLIFNIRKELQQGYNRRTNIIDVLKDYSWQLFTYNLSLNTFLFVIYLVCMLLNGGFLLPIIYLVVLIITFFINQSIIIDEFGPVSAIQLSYEFVTKYKLRTFLTILGVFILFLLITLISYYIPGGYVLGIILMHLFVYPVLEIVRTIVYLTKFKILESYL